MAVIANIDGPNRRIYLHADTKNAEVDPMDIYKAQRSLRRTDESLRRYDLFLGASGYTSKGGGKFTPKLTTCLSDVYGLLTEIVPYDETGTLTIIGEIISDKGTSGLACFDKTLLTPGVLVDINYFPPQVEVIEVNTGSGISEQDKLDIIGGVWAWIITGSLTSADYIVLIKKLMNNKVTKAGEIITIYEDDNTTPWKQYDLTDGQRIEV